jgi:hypothetical protein
MTLHPDEIDTKTIGLKWTADFDEFDRATENGIELVHHDYPQDMMAGKILKVQVHSFFDDSMWPEEKNLDPASRRSWKVMVETHTGNGTTAFNIDVHDREHGMQVVNYYYNLILFGEKELGYIQDPYGAQSWFNKEPF